MGDGSYHDIKLLLSQKTAEVETLNASMLAQSARSSNLQARVIQTLDVLDETQRSHAGEIKDLEHKYAGLNRRFQKHRNALTATEAERDDLKDSVLELVEKVEQSNDIRSWPFNRLQLTKFTEHSRQLEPLRQPLNEEDQLAYAGAIIDRLRRERDDERVAHALTREALQSKTDMFEAQLARREAELEFYATHATCTSPVLSGRNDANVGSRIDDGGSKPRKSRSRLPDQATGPGQLEHDASHPIPGQSLTNEAIINLLSTTAARNRALEVEIKTLFRRLHQARSARSSPSASIAGAPPQVQPSENDAVPQPQPSDSPVFSVQDDVVAYGLGDTRHEDGHEVTTEGFEHPDDPVGHNQDSHSTRTRRPSRTRTHRQVVTPSGQASHVDNHSRMHRRKGTRLGNSKANVEAHEDDEQFHRNHDQDLATLSPIHVFQSTPTPVSDSIHHHHHSIHVHDDTDDTIWSPTSPVVGSRVRTSDRGTTPLAEDHVSPMYGTGRGGKGHVGVVDSRDDANFLDLHATSSLSEGGGGSRLRSATLVGLDVEIQELSAQIDAFMHERDKLSKFVATRWQRVSPPREEEDILSSSPLVFAPVSEVGDDNQSRYQEADSVVEGGKNTAAVHGDDRDGRTTYTRVDELGMLTRRLSAVEDECLQLRQELHECRATSESRENELLREIQALQRRVAELSLLCYAPSFISEPNAGAFFDGNTGGQDLSHRLEHPYSLDRETDSPSLFDQVPPLVPDNTNEGDLPISHLRPRDQTSDGANLQTEVHPLPSSPVVEPYVGIAEPLLVSPLQPQDALPNAQVSWLRLDDAELDGLLDAIDGEASMELATPLMPTTLLKHSTSSSTSDSLPHVDSEHGDHDDGSSQDMVLEDDLQGDGASHYVHERRESDGELGLHQQGDLQYEFFELDDGDPRLHDSEEGDASGMTPKGVVGFNVSDDNPDDDDVDVDEGIGSGSCDFHDPSPSAPLLKEGERESQFDDDEHLSTADDTKERQQPDGSNEMDPWQYNERRHHDADDPQLEHQAQLEGDDDETVLAIPRSESQSLIRSPRLTDTTSANRDSNSASPLRHPHQRPVPRLQTRSRSHSPTIYEEDRHAGLILERAEHELSLAQEMLEQGENALRSVEANLSLESPQFRPSPPA